MTEKKIYQLAYSWANHVWAKADSDLQKNPNSKCLKEAEQRAWENLLEIEQTAKEKGYDLQGEQVLPFFFCSGTLITIIITI